MQDEAVTIERAPDEVAEIPSHAHPEWVMSSDGRKLVDRPRNLREWIKWEVFYFRRRRARRRRPPT